MEQQIAAIRQRFEAELPQNSARFHLIDIERVRTEDWQVKRYILDNEDDIEAAYKSLIKTLEWKCKWGVHDNLLTRYPIEAFDICATELFADSPGDLETGRPVFCELMRTQRQYAENEAISRDFVIAWAEHMDRVAGERGVTTLSDFTGSSLLRVNLSLTKFRFHILPRYYPGLGQRIVLHNVPKACVPPLKFAFKLYSKAIGGKVVWTSGADGHFKYIDRAQLHTDYGGLRTERRYPMPGLKSIWTIYPQLGLERKFVETWLKEGGWSKKEMAAAEDDAAAVAAAAAASEDANGVLANV